MATNQLSGLVSGFDWKTFIDSTIEYSRVPATRLEAEKAANNRKNTALSTLDGKMTVLQTAIADLQSSAVFSARTASLPSTATAWTASAGAGTVTGAYKINVAQIATASRINGTTDIALGLSATNDVSGLTLATLPVGAPVTAGTFTIDGKQIAVTLDDSLQDVFDRISTATSGAVTAAYDFATDKVTLTGSGPITLGAANDSSNFLSALRLANNGTASVSSNTALSSLTLSTPLGSSNLRTPVAAGAGSFTINGVNIAYDAGTDSVKSVLQRINASTAGVSATYDSATDRVILANKTTGDTGIFLSDDTGNVLGALGLIGGGAALARGKNTLYTIDDGPDLISASNTLASASHGIDGLSITVKDSGEHTVTVASDTSAMKGKIEAFISAFNSVQTFIEEQTKTTAANGKVTTSTLSSEREVEAWSQTLRRNAFSSVDGLSGTINRLESLGIDFTTGTSLLAIKSSSTLTGALNDHPDDVAAFFTTASTGFSARFKTAVDLIAGNELQKGYIDQEQTRISTSNTSLDVQIAAIDRQLEQQRELLTSSFIAMENAQSGYNNMQTQLTKAFFSDTKK
jgi:flagellar hook-associated protein 2